MSGARAARDLGAGPRGRAMSAALHSGMVLAGLVIIGVLATIAVLAPLIAPYHPTLPSGPSLAPPSAAHLLGTNKIGADVLSGLIYGARLSLAVAVPAGALAVAAGAVVGVGAGMLSGAAGQVAARVLDGFLALPMLPLIILLAAFAGSSPPVLIVIIAAAGCPPIARVLRAQTLTVRQRGFLAVARGLGGGPGYLMRRHLIPAVSPILVAAYVNWTGTAFVLHAALAFLGIGDPTGVSWGMTINQALDQSGIYTGGGLTWLMLPAGGAIAVAVLGFVLLGVGLETTMNPRARRAV